MAKGTDEGVVATSAEVIAPVVEVVGDLPKVEAKVEPVGAPAVDIKEEESGDDKEERIRLSQKAFDRRVKQAARALMREQLGVDDAAAIKKVLDEHAQLSKKNEEERRKKLDEIERLREDLKAAGESKAQIERELASIREQQIVDETEREIVGAAGKHVADEFLDYASFEFGRYVRGLDADEVEKLTDKKIEAWFDEFGKKHPQMVRGGATPPAPPALEVKASPITTGAPKPKTDPVSDPLAGKTPKPGQPNSMTRAEFKQWMRSQGYAIG